MNYGWYQASFTWLYLFGFLGSHIYICLIFIWWLFSSILCSIFCFQLLTCMVISWLFLYFLLVFSFIIIFLSGWRAYTWDFIARTNFGPTTDNFLFKIFMMIMLCWNVRGVGWKGFRHEIKEIIHLYHPDIIFL